MKLIDVGYKATLEDFITLKKISFSDTTGSAECRNA
jgi:hypothetical protein